MARDKPIDVDSNVISMGQHVEDHRLTNVGDQLDGLEATRPGRPSKMTDHVVDVFCGAIRRGAPTKHAALIAGVSEQAVANWKRRALEALHTAGVIEGVEYSADYIATKLPDSEKPYVEFWWKYRVAESFGMVDLLEKVRKSPDWHAHAWLLKTRHRDDFGDSLDVRSGADGPLEPSAARQVFMSKIDRLMQQGNAIDVDAKPIKATAPKKRKAIPRKAPAKKQQGTA